MESGIFSLPRKLTVTNTDQILLTRTPSGANVGVLSIGDGPFDGVSSGKFIGSSSSTFLAINAASSFLGNIADWQVAGVSKFIFSISGRLTLTALRGNNTNSTILFEQNVNNSTTTAQFQYLPSGGIALNGSNVQQVFLSVAPTINQTSTAGYTALLINSTETATGSGTRLLIDTQVGSVSKFNVDSAGNTTAAGALNDGMGLGGGGRLANYYNFT